MSISCVDLRHSDACVASGVETDIPQVPLSMLSIEVASLDDLPNIVVLQRYEILVVTLMT